MKIRLSHPNVFVADEEIISVPRALIDELKDELRKSRQQRVRFCAHRDVSSPIHEMIITLGKKTFVRPHQHPGKSESFHVIEGQGDIVIFNERGNILDVIRMGDYSSGKAFYYRLSSPLFHTVVVRSDMFIFHETTNGPFRKEDAIFPSWAPEEGMTHETDEYMERLRDMISRFRKEK